MKEFKHDFTSYQAVPSENKGEAMISGEFDELLQAVEVFGFYLASIDMRQDSSVHEACVAGVISERRNQEHYSCF